MNRNRRRVVASAALLFLAAEAAAVQLFLPARQSVRLGVCGGLSGATALWLWALLRCRPVSDDPRTSPRQRAAGVPRCEGGRVSAARAHGRGSRLP
ncbi:hypothetical protein [Streptomyces qinzhouensis]|uniref:Uncharacterized protein n=1 Tax=Streptomyces qinzhouensis TaxID=2599401 RepID=A0A5B8J8D0_9ACTN|nr:hypothetical protein [Streptomyces qinzhouensis]QDY76151.1 hypothetical protein FQU76_06005 [Streptomyces qinzhouensis]